MDGSLHAPSSSIQTLLICAMGGEGGGVLTGWIVEAARAQGLAVQATSVPGVAQRTGGTTYYIEMAPRDVRGRQPVFALTPVPGQVDVVLASELVEGARAARMGFATPDRTISIASTHRVFLINEKMAMGDGRIDPEALRRTLETRSRRAMFLDMDRLAQQAGVPISPVLLGSLAGCGALPIERDRFEQAIRASGIAVEKNLAAFRAAYESIGAPEDVAPSSLLAASDFIIADAPAGRYDVARFPAVARGVIAHGIDRLTDYQDADYAALYVKRLEPFASGEPDLLKEVARHLALRMSYEDVIRVAQHKARPERFERIAGEVGTRDEPYEVQDFFKPGAREIADILSPRMGAMLLRWADRSPRVARTHVGMKVKTTTVSGYLRVWLLARLKPRRRRTFRYQAEQAAIEAWLSLVQQAVDKGDMALAREIVELARLIKGYGETHLRGQASYGRIVGEIVAPALDHALAPPSAAGAVRAARDAALADPEGVALADVISPHRKRSDTAA